MKPFAALLDPRTPRTAVPRSVATRLLLGFRDTDSGPAFEDTVKIGYGFYDRDNVLFLSTCVADVVEELGGVIIGQDQINNGRLLIDTEQQVWEWELPEPTP